MRRRESGGDGHTTIRRSTTVSVSMSARKQLAQLLMKGLASCYTSHVARELQHDDDSLSRIGLRVRPGVFPQVCAD